MCCAAYLVITDKEVNMNRFFVFVAVPKLSNQDTDKLQIHGGMKIVLSSWWRSGS